MRRSFFLAASISVIVFAVVACGSSTDERELTSAQQFSESVEDVSKLSGTGESDRRARRMVLTGTESDAGPRAVGGVANFPDELIEKTIRLQLRQPDGDLLVSDLETVTNLGMSLQLYVTTISGLELLVNLTEFDLTQNMTSDISPLTSLTKLTKLNLTQNDVGDISSLAGLTNLTFLWLQDNIVSDISPLAGLTKLTELNLQKNEISDISALAALTDLTLLNLTSNKISDLSPLASLNKLTVLQLAKNEITDISPLLEIGLGEGTTIRMWGLDLDTNSVDVVIPQLEAAGVKVQF